jgi:hypothetical protein
VCEKEAAQVRHAAMLRRGRPGEFGAARLLLCRFWITERLLAQADGESRHHR